MNSKYFLLCEMSCILVKNMYICNVVCEWNWIYLAIFVCYHFFNISLHYFIDSCIIIMYKVYIYEYFTHNHVEFMMGTFTWSWYVNNILNVLILCLLMPQNNLFKSGFSFKKYIIKICDIIKNIWLLFLVFKGVSAVW